MFKSPEKKPFVMEIHGERRVDDYYWMRERDSKPVLDYLRQENQRVRQALKPVEALEKTLFEEMKSRIKESDQSVPVQDGDYFYYTKVEAGKEYAIHARKQSSLESPEVILLDENQEAEGQSYYDMADAMASPNHQILAYTVDTVGRRFYELKFKDLRTGQLLTDRVENITPSFVWAADNKTVFFVKQDPQTLRAFQVFRYQIGSAQAPELVYEEMDPTFSVELHSSKNGEKLFMNIAKTQTSEWRVLNAHEPNGQWQVMEPRSEGHEYAIEDAGESFYVLSNWQAKNFRLLEGRYDNPGKAQWREVLAHDPKILREGVAAYRTHLVISERTEGLPQIRLIERKTGTQRLVQFPDPVYEVSADDLPEYNSPYFRFIYESLNRPRSVFDENFTSRERVLRKEKEVPGFDKSKYESRRVWAKARDGARIPISVLVPKGATLNGLNPLLLYGYGSYGLNNAPHFWSAIFSLVDRGFVFAIPHIRGGSEMGRDWYDQGRLQQKMNTFTDFIDAAETLIRESYTSPEHLHVMGGSAGGLLMGAVMNMRPDLFKSVTASVPFVDVLTTMLDESIPLTTSEYQEWGDPRVAKDYHYMRQYSPYDNVEAKAYPNVFVDTGYHDSQVQYWEPAKWVAKLRDLKTDSNLLLFYTELDAGHSGATGRYEALKLWAKEFAFILMVEGHGK
ncbi:MAG: S9 family peptidase [Bdellovibrionales bacterium]